MYHQLGRALLTCTGWFAVVVGGYAAAARFASTAPPADCEWIGCLSNRDALLFAAIYYGWLLALCFGAGLLITAAFSKRKYHPLAAGSLGFFSAVLLFAIGAVVLWSV